MTEQEYIYVRDLSNVLMIRRCLRDLNPGFSVMTQLEIAEIARKLQKWEESLFAKIETTKFDSSPLECK